MSWWCEMSWQPISNSPSFDWVRMSENTVGTSVLACLHNERSISRAWGSLTLIKTGPGSCKVTSSHHQMASMHPSPSLHFTVFNTCRTFRVRKYWRQKKKKGRNSTLPNRFFFFFLYFKVIYMLCNLFWYDFYYQVSCKVCLRYWLRPPHPHPHPPPFPYPPVCVWSKTSATASVAWLCAAMERDAPCARCHFSFHIST